MWERPPFDFAQGRLSAVPLSAARRSFAVKLTLCRCLDRHGGGIRRASLDRTAEGGCPHMDTAPDYFFFGFVCFNLRPEISKFSLNTMLIASV
jgi:hypothetical protein